RLKPPRKRCLPEKPRAKKASSCNPSQHLMMVKIAQLKTWILGLILLLIWTPKKLLYYRSHRLMNSPFILPSHSPLKRPLSRNRGLGETFRRLFLKDLFSTDQPSSVYSSTPS